MRSQPPHLTKAQMEIRSAHRVHLRPLPAQGEDIQDELQRTGLSQLLLPGRPPGLVIHHESFLTRLTEVYAIDTTAFLAASNPCSISASTSSSPLPLSPLRPGLNPPSRSCGANPRTSPKRRWRYAPPTVFTSGRSPRRARTYRMSCREPASANFFCLVGRPVL